MTTGETASFRELARAAVTSLLASPPWEDFSPRVLVLLVRPPTSPWAEPDTAPTLWIILGATEARGLPPQLREPLLAGGAQRVGEHEGFDVEILTSEAVARAFDGVPRSSLELRWTVRHAEPLHDPLHRADGLAATAGRLPSGSLERIVRPLFVQAATATGALSALPLHDHALDLLVLAGEAAGALMRLACVLEDGTHPPAEYLAPAAHESRLGARIRSWLDDLAPAVADDARAARWVRESAPGALREAATALHAEFGGRDWLRDPQGYALRPTR